MLVDKEELERAEKLLEESALLPEGQKNILGPQGDEKARAGNVAQTQEKPTLETGEKGQGETVQESGVGSSPPSPSKPTQSVSISPSHSLGSSEFSDPSLLSTTDPSLMSTTDPSLMSSMTTTDASQSYISTETSGSQLSQLSSDSDTEAEPFEMVKKEDIQP